MEQSETLEVHPIFECCSNQCNYTEYFRPLKRCDKVTCVCEHKLDRLNKQSGPNVAFSLMLFYFGVIVRHTKVAKTV